MEGVSYLHNAELEADMKLIADLNNYTFTLDENRLRLNAIETTLDGCGGHARHQHRHGHQTLHPRKSISRIFCR